MPDWRNHGSTSSVAIGTCLAHGHHGQYACPTCCSSLSHPIGAANPPTTGVEGCDECNRGADPKPWPIFTVTLASGVEVCAKCLTPMTWPKRVRRG